MNRFAPLLTVERCDQATSAAHVAASNTGVLAIVPIAFARPCQVSPRGPLVSPSFGRPTATPSTCALSGVFLRYEISALVLMPAMFLAMLAPNNWMLSA